MMSKRIYLLNGPNLNLLGQRQTELYGSETLNDVTAHAEMQAITAAASFLGGKYLKDCTMYITLEPCQMCAGALYWSQISRIVIAAPDPHRGFKTMGGNLHPKTEVKTGVLADEASALIKRFFIEKRNLN